MKLEQLEIRNYRGENFSFLFNGNGIYCFVEKDEKDMKDSNIISNIVLEALWLIGKPLDYPQPYYCPNAATVQFDDRSQFFSIECWGSRIIRDPTEYLFVGMTGDRLTVSHPYPDITVALLDDPEHLKLFLHDVFSKGLYNNFLEEEAQYFPNSSLNLTPLWMCNQHDVFLLQFPEREMRNEKQQKHFVSCLEKWRESYPCSDVFFTTRSQYIIESFNPSQVYFQ